MHDDVRGLAAMVMNDGGDIGREDGATREAVSTDPLRVPPVEPLEGLVSPEEIKIGERVGRKRGQEPGPFLFFAELNAGLILTAAAIVLFKTPNHFAFGGTSGVSVVLSTLFPQLPVGAFMWIINAVLVALGFLFLERKAIMWSVFASFALSGYVSLFESLRPPVSSITGDMWLDLCFAVILPALGSAIVFDIGASTGGTDILAMILKRHSTMEIGRALLLVDIGIVCVAAVLYGPRVGLYCVLGLFAKTLVVDKAIENIRLRKVCTVICKEPLKVESYIVKELKRTATISRGYGAFTGQCVTVIMSVLSRREAVRLRRYVRTVDPDAFITIVDSSEIVGKGFRGVN
ncbi:MAG: YitT family protein [Collinsella sp.]|nr:YitT family protein [Collinsella sp.]